jgi:hypothetical protein
MRKIIKDNEISEILSLLESSSAKQKSAIKSLLNTVLTPHYLESLKKSNDPRINKYVQERFKQIYKIKGTFEETFAQKMLVDVDDLFELGTVDSKEYELMKKESGKARAGSLEYFDFTEALGFISYHLSLALTSPIDYIRTLAEVIKNNP